MIIEPFELNRRIRAVQAELDDIDRLDEPERLSGLRGAVEERLDTLLAQHRAITGRSMPDRVKP